MQLLPNVITTTLNAADQMVGMVEDTVVGTRALTKLYRVEMADLEEQIQHDITLRKLERAKELKKAEAETETNS
jgi:hypothetical protein